MRQSDNSEEVLMKVIKLNIKNQSLKTLDGNCNI